MNLAKKLICAVLSFSMAATYALCSGSASAETLIPDSVPVNEGAAIVQSAELKPETSTSEQYFNVFDIYNAYLESVNPTYEPTEPPTEPPTQPATVYNKFPMVDCSNGLFGIDVSKWQGVINWQKVKTAGVNYAIIRAGYGNLVSQKDPMFDTNMVNAEKAGINRGVYWYSYATSVEDAYKEADACYEVIKNYHFEYPLVFDIEDKCQTGLSTATVSAIIDAFCSRMESRGYFVSVYSYASFLNTKVYKSTLDRYCVYVAHFNVAKPDINHSYAIWQYSSTGRVDGIDTVVDLDKCYFDFPYNIYRTHKNGYTEDIK